MHSMEYGKAFAFMTDEPDWVTKFLIAAFMPLVPLVGPFLLLGYAFEITRRVIKNEKPTLPDWADFGDYLKKGAVTMIIWVVYSLPFALLVACLNVPTVVLMQNDDATLRLAGQALGFCGSCLAILFGIFANLVIPAAIGHSAARGSLGAAFQLGDIATLVRTKPAIYLVIAIILGVLSVVLLPIGFLLCVVGIFVFVAYINIAAAHLYGQAYRVTAIESGLMPVGSSQ
jgi:hypothetical protein